MRKIFTFFLVVFAMHVHAQQLHLNNTRFIGGDGSCATLGLHAIGTRDEGVLFTGFTNCNNKGDIPPNIPDVGSAVPANVVIGKLDSNEQLQWIKVYGGTHNDEGVAACQTSDGGYAVLARTESNDGDVTGFKGVRDIWLIRLDSNGNLLWQKTYGSSYDDEPISVTATTEDGFIILGGSTGSGGDVPSHYSTSQFSYDWIVIKTDSLGNKIWSKSFGGSDNEDINGSILAFNNNYYLASSSLSTDHDCNDFSWHSSSVNTYSDFYLLKLDTMGSLIWSKSYGGSRYEQAFNAIVDDRDSTIVIAGSSSSNDYMIFGNHGASGSVDELVVKVDVNGNLKWAKMAGDITDEIGQSVIKYQNNGYATYAYLEPGTSHVPAQIGQRDGWAFILDSSGGTIAEKLFGGTSDELLGSIVPHRGGFAIVGYTLSQVFTEGTNSPRQIPFEDIFVSYFDYFPTAINNLRLKHQQLELFPNPSHNRVRISLSFEHKDGRIKITDVTGQIIYKREINSHTGNLDVVTSEWPHGIYTISYTNEDGTTLTSKLSNY